MGQLSAPVPLHNVDDVEGFVLAAIRKLERVHSLNLSWDDRDELQLEGFLIMCRLAREYRPAPGGWSFSSYAGDRLPGRLLNAWHRLRPGEQYRAHLKDGTRPWLRREIASLDAELAQPGFDERGLRLLTDFVRIPAAGLVPA